MIIVEKAEYGTNLELDKCVSSQHTSDRRIVNCSFWLPILEIMHVGFDSIEARLLA